MRKGLFRVLLVLLVILLCATVVSVSAFSANGFATGTGTATDPYVITTVAQLKNVKNDMSAHYVLGNDIVFSDSDTWQPIGLTSSETNRLWEQYETGKITESELEDKVSFSGSIDGKGYSIVNLNYSYSNDFLGGVFVGINKGIIKNINFVNATVDLNVYTDTAFICSENDGLIDNCSVDGSIEASYTEMNGYSMYLSSFVTYNSDSGKITNCVNNANVNLKETISDDTWNSPHVAGFAINSYGEIINCVNNGNISINSKLTNASTYEESVTNQSYVAGIVAHNVDGVVSACKNTGKIEATIKSVDATYSTYTDSYAYVGGIAGNSESDIVLCENFGNVVANANSDCIGGIVGRSMMGIKSSSNNGLIKSYSSGSCAGGILGFGVYSIVENCYNCGSISIVDSSNSAAGGIVGEMWADKDGSHIINCYNIGAPDKSYSRSLYGYICGEFLNDYYNSSELKSCASNCYSLKDNGAINSVHNGTLYTDAQLKNEDNYYGFDFDDVWNVNVSSDYLYPVLQNCTKGHIGGFVTCDKDAGRCTRCGQNYIEKTNHKYENGVCSVCEEIDLSYNGWVFSKGYWYYIQNGDYYHGWLKYNNKWYYLEPEMYCDGTCYVWDSKTDTFNMYFFDEDGAMQTGWVKYLGDWYYCNPNNDSRVQIGWKQIGGKWYYFDEYSGVMHTGWLTLDGYNYYYLDPVNGDMKTGWQLIDGEWHYFNPKNDSLEQYGWCNINGYYYYFYANGCLASGYITIDGETYFLDPANDCRLATGWWKTDGKWKYYIDNGTRYYIDWHMINGKWYYFDRTTGYMNTGWFRDSANSKWYYLDPTNGDMAEGWKKIGGYWYYFTPGSGIMVSGWQRISGVWYYFNPSNDSRMSTGWLKIGTTWYYFTSDGAMVTGTQRIGGKTYKFNADGAWIA